MVKKLIYFVCLGYTHFRFVSTLNVCMMLFFAFGFLYITNVFCDSCIFAN